MQFADDRHSTIANRTFSAFASGTIILLMLLAGEMLLATRAVELANWDRLDVSLTPLALGGIAFGFLIARSRFSDVTSHLIGLFGGLAISLLYTTRYLDAPGMSMTGQLRLLIDLIASWLRESISGRNEREDLVLIAAMGLLVWLIAYTATWFLFRRGWFLPAIVLPAIPILLNLGNIDGGMGAAMLIYVLLALSIAAVQVSRLRTAHWQRAGLAFSTIAWRAPAIGGSAIALLAVALVWSSPVDPPESWLDAATDRLEAPISAIESNWNELAQRLSPPPVGGDYAEFGDSFDMGGALNLSDEPVALLRSDRAHYLAAQRYAIYTGKGWTSGDPAQIESALPDGATTDAPLVAFQAGQDVHLSEDVLGSRSEVGGTIELLAPTGNLLLTIDTFSSASEPNSATVSWRELEDERYELEAGGLADMPVELRVLGTLLQSATFVAGEGGLTATDAALNRQIEMEVAGLRSRFLSVRVTVNSDGEATALYATGWVPNYDDIESVSVPSQLGQGDVYSVTGWQSDATADQLRASAPVYPDYVTARYLGLPASVTEETRALSLSIAQESDTVFDTALSIQEYLRATYPYEEQISGPSSTQDAVHYFLFDEQQGYCEYFASAMVVMLRALDIPARLVAGFMQVPYDAEAQGFLYRQEQAHTWVEVYFDGYGWIAFEPTPSRGAFDYEGEEAEQDVVPSPTPEPIEPTAEPEPTVSHEETPTPSAGIAATDADDGSGQSILWYAGLSALGLSIAGGLFWLAYRSGRRRDASPAGARYYQQLVRSARKFGVLPTPATTPRELAASIAQTVPTAGPPATEVARLYRKEIYGGQELTPDDRQLGERAVRALRNAMRGTGLRSVGRKGKH